MLAVVKNNVARKSSSMAYRLVPDDLRDCARVQWEGASAHSATDLLRTHADEETKQDRAAAFLRVALRDGPVRRSELEESGRAS